jgi:ABC-2 type transport system permease protein
MSSLSYTLADSATMLRRNLRRAVRYPSLTLSTVTVPLVLLLLFVGLLGDTLGAGLGNVASAGSGYVDYVMPGIILMTVAAASPSTAVSVSVDMTGGIINRFRTMSIARSSVLTGHVIGSVIQTAIATVLVIGLAVLLGFDPAAGVLDWTAVAGLLALVAFALTWVAVLIGLVSRNPEAASNTPMLIAFLPFVSSAFVPTDSMPGAVRWFAENQPFTPMIETVRGLLLGTPIGDSAILAVGWCLVIGLAAYAASRHVFTRPREA